MSDNCRVLSIQSHVVSGYVGNRSATFPLQVLGFEVDNINSVQFSNHTGYKVWKGQILNADQLVDLFEGLKANELHHYSHLLTGYVGCKSFLSKVLDIVKELKTENPNLIYVCDPVMGDNGKLYVPEDLLPIYRDQIIPLADVVTPNQFEAELLTGVKINNENDAINAMNILHSRGSKHIVITSSDLGSEEFLVGLGSSSVGDSRVTFKLDIPKLPAFFLGTGDLFTSLLLAWMSISKGDLKLACEKTISTLQNVLKRTLQHAQDAAGAGKQPSFKDLELKLIQSKKDIEDPKPSITASLINLTT